MLKGKFKLLETQSQISKKIVSQIAASLNAALLGATPVISNRIKMLVRNAIVNSPEYNSLVGGDLQAELGIPSSGARLSKILETWLQNIKISKKSVKISSSRISGGISISMIRDDYRDVLGSPDASYITAKGRKIPWLEWLLIAGDTTLISDYIFTENSGRSKSRTGLGIMRYKPSARWHIPREFAGTIRNNFVTRALSKLENQIIQIMQTEIAKRLK